ncbi:Gfo/Idh/MocA family protein [Paenibacillus spongiae]|uniref:Gfo/Idh/MocA family oxidoreductase n=1 Tax=Paenibacillus spongiae TaxID=2909671 RepID=A0ABY5SFB6_9BACL|nr:Gfo/Idh/MocA family oxidoreductase [Paenibacillus spongiae]UVI30958.1 Gfo/Idh/MocA family oxidoreductase [Paenibacillus spongiae]
MSKVRVAVVGCGSVSHSYLPQLKKSASVDVVAVCDNQIERAKKHADEFGVNAYFDDIDKMLGEVKIDLMVNLTSMNMHAPFNKKALEKGINVWCEKPIATNLSDAYELLDIAKQKGVGMWGAPCTLLSPQYKQMSKIISSGQIGKACTAHGLYGWEGPSWGQWFYKKGGGALFDLGIYNITTLTGLLGPVQSVVAMAEAAIPERIVDGELTKVEADDNTAIIMDHGNGVMSVVQTGFVYKHQMDDWTIQVIGTEGTLAMEGYDWDPKGVRVFTSESGKWDTIAQDQGDYHWAGGATYVAECMAAGKQPIFYGEHALHALEIMVATLKAAETGRRVKIESTFPWAEHVAGITK